MTRYDCIVRQCDRDVRAALHSKVLNEHRRDGNTLVLNELGLRHGICRADIAVVNGLLHGFEIKSDADTLDRLPTQVQLYSEVFDKVTLVVGQRLVDEAMGMVPDWWGVKVAVSEKGCVHFCQVRNTRQNVGQNMMAISELLWKPEVTDILLGLGIPTKLLRKPRAELYAMLVANVSPNELKRLVREKLKSRAGWRGQKLP